jgi:hypothetical protein
MFGQAVPAHLNTRQMQLKREDSQSVGAWQQAYHAAVNRGGVRPDLVLDRVVVLVLVGCQDAVDLAANQPRLHCDLAAITLHQAMYYSRGGLNMVSGGVNAQDCNRLSAHGCAGQTYVWAADMQAATGTHVDGVVAEVLAGVAELQQHAVRDRLA